MSVRTMCVGTSASLSTESRFTLIYQGRRGRMSIGGRCFMAAATKKFTPKIDAALYEEFVVAAKKNGQSHRYVLEQALGFYLHNVVPSQHLVRPAAMEAFEQSVIPNRALPARPAK